MDQESFTSAFSKALQNKDVIETMKKTICGELRAQISHLKDIIQEKDCRITALEQQMKAL